MEYIYKSGFKVAPDGNILAKYGSESFRCGGIVQIQVSIEYTTDSNIKFVLSPGKTECQNTNEYDIVTGNDIPEYFQSAIFEGAKEVHLQNASSKGIKFTLIKALIHPIDANAMAFKYADKISLAAWYQLQLDSSRTSLTYNDLYQISPNLFKSPYGDDD